MSAFNWRGRPAQQYIWDSFTQKPHLIIVFKTVILSSHLPFPYCQLPVAKDMSVLRIEMHLFLCDSERESLPKKKTKRKIPTSKQASTNRFVLLSCCRQIRQNTDNRTTVKIYKFWFCPFLRHHINSLICVSSTGPVVVVFSRSLDADGVQVCVCKTLFIDK